MERHYRVRTKTGDPTEYLAIARRTGELRSSPTAQVAELTTTDLNTLRLVGSLLGDDPMALELEADFPAALLGLLPPSAIPRLQKAETSGAPVRIQIRLSGREAAGLVLPDGTLRWMSVWGDPGPAVDALHAAACERTRTRFFLLWESARWNGQVERFTYGAGPLIQKWDDGPPELLLMTSLRYPATTVVTGDIEEEWCREADVVLAGVAEALGVEIDPAHVII